MVVDVRRAGLVFHALPKTGSGSLWNMLALLYGGAFAHVDLDNHIDRRVVCGHLSYNEFMREYPGRRFDITIMREPRARLVSWVRAIRSEDSAKGEIARSLSAAEFLSYAGPDNWLVDYNAAYVNNRMVRQLGGECTKAKWTGDLEAQLERAKQRLDRMAWVGFTERLDEDLARLFELLGEDRPAGMRRRNVSSASAEVDEEAERVIDEMTVWDRKLWTHAQGLR